MKKYRNLTRVFSVILVLCMALSVLPITALAKETVTTTTVYLHFDAWNTGWGNTSTKTPVKLFEIPDGGTSASLNAVSGDIVSGRQYSILSTTHEEGNNRCRALHANDNLTTGQCGGSNPTKDTIFSTNTITNGCGNNHMFIFTDGNSDGTYSIKSVSNSKYLQPNSVVDEHAQLTFADDDSEVFKLEKDTTDGHTGCYYISWEIKTVVDEFSKYGADIANVFDESELDNSWVVVGGAAAEGGFAQVGGARNYAGHLEEYIRSTIHENVNATFHRFVINTAYSGLDLAGILSDFDGRVTNYKPRVVAYLIGAEDYDKGEEGVENFKTNLKNFIDKCLAEHNNQGFVLIQLPYATKVDEENTKIELYVDAVQSVLDDNYADNNGERIVVVNHYEKTKSDDAFMSGGLQSDGKTLTPKGHLILAEEIVSVTADKASSRVGSASQFPYYNSEENWIGTSKEPVELDAPSVYRSDLVLTVSGNGGKLTVSVPDGAKSLSAAWKYEIRCENGETVSGTANSGTFSVTGIPDGDFVLVVRTGDGATQLAGYRGTFTNGALAAYQEELSAPQKKIASFVAGDEPITWLFMGDSVTHGSGHTKGYDSISQLFDKYLDTLGREKDVVVNTAVSGSGTDIEAEKGTWRSTINNIDYRLRAFSAASPLVVAIQLGNNDGADWINTPVETYKANMEIIIDAVHEMNPQAVIILRSLTYTPSGAAKCPKYSPSLIEIAEDPKYSDYVMYEDQYTDITKAMTTYSYLNNAGNMYGDGVAHPGPAGHIVLVRKFIKALGLWTEDSPITNLYYELLTDSAKSGTPNVATAELDGGRNITLSVTANEIGTLCGGNIGEVTLSATNTKTGATYSISANLYPDSEVKDPVLTVPAGTYSVNVSAVSTASATRYNLDEVEVTAGKEIPEAPTEEEVKALLGDDFVTVSDEESRHSDRTYGWLENGVTILEAVNDPDNDGIYEATIIIKGDTYKNEYDSDVGYSHTFASGTSADQNVTLLYKDGAWTLGDTTGITYAVRCDYGTTNPPAVIPPVTGGGTQSPEDQTPPAPDDGDTDIPDDDTPLAPAPSDKGDTDIEDGDTPLDSTPKTGDEMMSIVLLWVLCTISAFCLGGIAYCRAKSGKHGK